MEKRVLKVLLLALTLSTVVKGDLDNDMQDEFEPLVDRVNANNTLNYGEICDYKLEQERQGIMNSLILLLSKIEIQDRQLNRDDSLYLMKDHMVEIMNSLADLNGKLCKSHENLQCNTKGFCDCVEVDDSLPSPAFFKREGNECVLKLGSICAPEDFLDRLIRHNPLAQYMPTRKCAAESKCVVKSNGKTCDSASMYADIRRMMSSADYTANPVNFVLKKLQEGICVCKEATALEGATALASGLLVGICAILFVTFF